MSKIADKIKELASKAASERLNEEQRKTQGKVNQDLAQVEKILSMVKDRLVYKEVRDYGSRKYIVVTEKMVIEDYIEPPEYSSGKTGVYLEGASMWNVKHTKIYVNGHLYYHAQDIFARYEWEIKQSIEKNDQEREMLNKKHELLKELKELEPVVKQIILNYQTHLSETMSKDTPNGTK